MPERGPEKVPGLHEKVVARLERAVEMDRWFQNHGHGDLFVGAFMEVFALGPCQELAASARRQMWDEVVRMVTALVRRTEGAYRIACSSKHVRRHAKAAVAAMTEQGSALEVR